MAAENQRQEIPSVRSAIEGESSSQSPTQGNVHGKDLVTRIFGDPEALSMLREAIFFEASSHSSSDARALKAHHEASEITAPASKRPRGAEPLEQEVVVLDPEPINQDDAHEQANTSIVDKPRESIAFLPRVGRRVIRSLPSWGRSISPYRRLIAKQSVALIHDRMSMQYTRLLLTLI